MNKKTDLNEFFQKVWTFFTSIKLTVVILLTLAATSIIGTLIAQNQTQAYYKRVYGEFFYALFSMMAIFDMYRSWWFQLLLALLFLNIIACSVNRLSSGWKVIFPKTPRISPERIKSAATPIEFKVKKSVDEATDICASLISRTFGHHQIRKDEKGRTIVAEKNRWSRIGVYVVHLSVIFLIIGGLIGSFFGFAGYAVIPEGESTRHIQLKNSDHVMALPFEIRCESFSVSFYPTGAPKEYKSSLTLLENGKSLVQKDIIVNDPLRYQGISIYQSSYGRMPATAHSEVDLSSRVIHLHIMEAATGMTHSKNLKMGESFELPDGKGIFLLKEHSPSEDFMGQNIGNTLIGVISAPGKEVEAVKLPLQYPNFDRMRRGDFVFSVGNAFELLEHAQGPRQYYTGLQVTKDPGVWVVYSGFILMIIGCFISFFLSHRQIIVEIKSGQKNSHILLAGIANKNKAGMELKLKKLSERMNKDLSSK